MTPEQFASLANEGFNRIPLISEAFADLDAVAAAVGEESDTLEDVYEPFLLQLGLEQPARDVFIRAAYELLQLVSFFTEQIYDVAEWLTGSREIDEEKLAAEIRRKNRILVKVRRLLDLRLRHPFYIRSLAIIYLLNGLNTLFGKPQEYEEAIDLLLDELARAPESPEELQAVIPLVWAGGTGQEFGVFQAIDDAGGALLGFRSVPFKNYREDVPPVESLARYVLDNQNAGASVYARHVIEHEVNKVQARGLILYGYLGCSYGSVAREMFRDYFHKKGIPSINLEGTFQVGAPSGQILTRVKAFVEMLS